MQKNSDSVYFFNIIIDRVRATPMGFGPLVKNSHMKETWKVLFSDHFTCSRVKILCLLSKEVSPRDPAL